MGLFQKYWPNPKAEGDHGNTGNSVHTAHKRAILSQILINLISNKRMKCKVRAELGP
jgi:hypothetical protein